MSIVNTLNETMSHFDVDELKRDEVFEKLAVAKDVKEEQDLSMFKSHWVGGQRVIDLTSVDEDYTEYESFNRAEDIERQQIYGDKAGSTAF